MTKMDGSPGELIKPAAGRKGGGGVDSRRSGHHVCACACTRTSVRERMGLDIRELIQAAKTAVHFINMHERAYSSTYGRSSYRNWTWKWLRVRLFLKSRIRKYEGNR